MVCKICSAYSVETFGRSLVLGKYDVQFFRCASCGYVCTEEPYWLEEAYSEAITGSDVGLVSRNIAMSKIAAVIIACFFDTNGRFLDYAGGYGLFVRMMRDRGFDFHWRDPHCPDIFARGFESPEADAGNYELVTAFEVMEHLASPVAVMEEILSRSRNILFSTELIPAVTPGPGEWWYYGLEHGQHVSFHTRESLGAMAARFGLHFYTNGKSLHLFSEKRLPSSMFYLLARSKAANVLSPLLSGKTLLHKDFEKIAQKELR